MSLIPSATSTCDRVNIGSRWRVNGRCRHTPGFPKRPDTLSKQLSKLVWDRLGIRFSPHLMRQLAAMMHANERPGDYETPRRLLGHRSYDTTFQAYQGMETKSANRLHDQLIRSKRRYPVMPAASAKVRLPKRPSR